MRNTRRGEFRLTKAVMYLARNDVQARQFMTAPGIGLVTAFCYLATIAGSNPERAVPLRVHLQSFLPRTLLY